MPDRSTPNLPSRDFDTTESFYGALGFATEWRNGDWMILARGSLLLEFFPCPWLDPLRSDHSCCLWLDDLDAFYDLCRRAGVPELRHEHPCLLPPQPVPGRARMAVLLDPDRSLLRLMEARAPSGRRRVATSPTAPAGV